MDCLLDVSVEKPVIVIRGYCCQGLLLLSKFALDIDQLVFLLNGTMGLCPFLKGQTFLMKVYDVRSNFADTSCNIFGQVHGKKWAFCHPYLLVRPKESNRTK